MNMKAMIVELAETIGLLFTIAVLLTFYWNLIVYGISKIDWKMATLLMFILGISMVIGNVFKQKANGTDESSVTEGYQREKPGKETR